MLNVGDTIKCSKDEIVELMTELEKEGYRTDFLYEKEGKEGYWLEIKGVDNAKTNEQTD